MAKLKQKHLKVLILGLMVIGVLAFGYKVLRLGLPLTPKSEKVVWNIEAELSFQAKNSGVKAELYIPAWTQNFTTINEYFVSPNYSVTTQNEDDNRLSVWAKRNPKGGQNLFYRIQVVADPNTAPDTRDEKDYVDKPELTGAQGAAINALVTQVRAKSADIATFASETIKLLNKQTDSDSNAALLLGRSPDRQKLIGVAMQVLAGANIRSQMLHGFMLEKNDPNAQLQTWLEVWNGSQWLYVDPQNGKIGLPKNFFTWWRGDGDLFAVKGAKNPHIHFAISKAYLDAVALAQDQNKVKPSKLMEFSLFNLPLSTQQVYQQLLTIPIGVFIILLIRSFIGIKTFGTFMPVLIALAFRETQLIVGLGFFVLIISCGLLVRFYLDQFKLLLVPRLAGILMVVILMMTFISLLTYKLGILSGLSVALFPMVILTMTIERMSIVWEERGAGEAIQQATGSLVTASIAFIAMQNEYLKHLFFVFPEIIFILLAITLMIGRYQGYRLLELVRFKSLIEKLDQHERKP